MSESKRKHVEYQTSYFDNNCEFFRQEIPQEVVERTKQIVAAARLTPQSRVLDVGTGMGVLITHFRAHGVQPKNIVGCDLSEQMLAEAQRRQPESQFWQGDFAELPQSMGVFDAIFFNACFGNFFDMRATAENAAQRLAPGGRIVISHPMGNRFVIQLKTQDPRLVLHALPKKAELEGWCAAMGLALEHFQDEPDLYIGILKR
jgi:ubiquinone/menaquinone biosynthesis C-methylase UbiE